MVIDQRLDADAICQVISIPSYAVCGALGFKEQLDLIVLNRKWPWLKQ